MSKIVVYTLNCGRHGRLERMLERSGVPYSRVTDEAVLREKNLEFFPTFEVDGVLLDYKKAQDVLEVMCNEQSHKAE